MRYVFLALLFSDIALVHAMRLNLSVSIIAMVNSCEHDSQPSSNSRDVHSSDSAMKTKIAPSSVPCKEPPSQRNNILHAFIGSCLESSVSPFEFDWDGSERAMILHALFVGYILTQILEGYLAETYSASRMDDGSCFCSDMFHTTRRLEFICAHC